METNKEERLQGKRQQGYFRFNADWILEAGFEERLKWEWNSNNLDVLKKLKNLGLSLSNWAKQEKKQTERRTKELNDRLSKLGAGEISDEVLKEITNIKLELNLEADKEELFWEQRARVNWLRLGDRNTAFFHKSATQRKRKKSNYRVKK